MTYGGFQRFDECQAYYKMKREQKEDDKRLLELSEQCEVVSILFDKDSSPESIERLYELVDDREENTEDVHDLENYDIEDLVNEESKQEE